MIRVLIVDDEKTIRNGLEKAVPWKEHGYMVVYTAKNGIDALDFFKKNYADVVISDIKMPRMDGLTLQEKLHEKYPKIPFIFISGYESFSFVQQALKQGAFSYLLKPVDTHELLLEVDRACKQFHLNNENMPLKQIIERNFGGLEKKWDFKDFEYLEKDFYSNYFCVLNIRCNYNDMHSQLFFLTFQKKIQDIIETCFSARYFSMIETSCRGIIFCVMNSNINALKYSIHQLVEQLNTRLEEFASTPVGLWTGGVYRGIQHLVDSYVESFENNSFKYESQPNTLLYADNISFDIYSELFSSEDAIITSLLKTNIDEAKSMLLSQQDLILNHQLSADDARLYLTHLLYKYIKSLKDAYNNIHLPEEVENYKLFTLMSIPQMFEQLYHYIEIICQSSHPLVINQSTHNVQKIKLYIEQNYSDPYLSLSTIATHIALNASYLSTEFARHEGTTISSYILNIRVEHAKQLLLHSELRISDISDAVGYLNSTYFSTCFKRVTGTTPSEFRKSTCSY